MYSTKYILAFATDLNEFYEIYFDFLNFVGNPQAIFGTDGCLQLRSTGGDENKLEPILGTEALINIVVGKITDPAGITWDNSNLSVTDLIAQHDNDIRVSVYKERDYTKTIFQGFIVVEDNSQPFLDPPFTLSVRALDGLGLLKGVDFTDTTGTVFSGSMTVIEWLANILYKTDQTLNIRVYFNIIHNSFPLIPALESVSLNVSTFLKASPATSTDPTVDEAALEADDCYTALEKIVRCFRCKLFQQDGVWCLVNIWEYANPNGYSFNEYQIGVPVLGVVGVTRVTTGNNLNYDVRVGFDQIIHPVQDDAARFLKLGTKWEKLTYSYDQSLNKICNQDLIQGDPYIAHNGTISSTIQDNTILPVVTFNTLGYQAFCFDHFDNNDGAAGNSHPYPSIAPVNGAYIRSVVDALGYEIDRYMVLEATPNQMTYLKSSRLQIDTSDVLQLSFDWRTRDNVHTSSPSPFLVAFVFLYGIDGTFWALRSIADGSIPGNPNIWQSVDSNFHQGSGGSPVVEGPEISDTANNGWMNVSINSAGANSNTSVKAPISGDVEILFAFESIGGGTEYWFKNISISIIPYLQGSYKALKGDFNYSSSNSNIKQTYSEDIEISDSPKRYFKGALLESDGKTLMPLNATSGWVRNGFASDTPKRFTQIMETLLYNNLYRIVEKVEGSYRGLTWVDSTLAVRQTGYLNSYFMSDHPMPTKKFMLTSFDKDITTGIGRHVFVEVLTDQNDTGYVQPDVYEFQYIFQ